MEYVTEKVTYRLLLMVPGKNGSRHREGDIQAYIDEFINSWYKDGNLDRVKYNPDLLESIIQPNYD